MSIVPQMTQIVTIINKDMPQKLFKKVMHGCPRIFQVEMPHQDIQVRLTVLI